jgi:hypothetical protein
MGQPQAWVTPVNTFSKHCGLRRDRLLQNPSVRAWATCLWEAEKRISQNDLRQNDSKSTQETMPLGPQMIANQSHTNPTKLNQ